MTTSASSGVLVLDKPEGLSSAKALERVKRILGARKAGHAGTLDPFATGVLICCMGQATRLSRFFLHGTKHYEAVLHLGVETDTQDPTGTVTATAPVPEIDDTALVRILDRFVGEVEQSPPVFSALKHEGVPLYRLARAGRPVQKPPRNVRIHGLRLLASELPDVRFEVSCSGGTYIRTLCADIGRDIGCGGHLKWLRRTRCSGFDIGESVTLETLSASGEAKTFLLTRSEALRGMPALRVDAQTAERVKAGKSLSVGSLGPMPGSGEDMRHSQKDGRLYKVIAPNGRLLAVVREHGRDTQLEYCCVFPDIWP